MRLKVSQVNFPMEGRFVPPDGAFISINLLQWTMSIILTVYVDSYHCTCQASVVEAPFSSSSEWF